MFKEICCGAGYEVSCGDRLWLERSPWRGLRQGTAWNTSGPHRSRFLWTLSAMFISPVRFDTLLEKYVDFDGNMNETSWKPSSVDRAELKSFLGELIRASLSTPATKNGQLAFGLMPTQPSAFGMILAKCSAITFGKTCPENLATKKTLWSRLSIPAYGK